MRAEVEALIARGPFPRSGEVRAHADALAQLPVDLDAEECTALVALFDGVATEAEVRTDATELPWTLVYALERSPAWPVRGALDDRNPWVTRLRERSERAYVPERIIGLDGEMSGSRIDEGHRLIQIGVAIDTAADGTRLAEPALFCSLIGWPDEDLVWDPEAERVHRIPREQILQAPAPADVDDALMSWLAEHDVSDARDRRFAQIMCGFNVGVFDAPFLRATLPRTAACFARRYADLNPVMFALGSSLPLDGRAPTSKAWKRHVKDVGMAYVRATGRTEAEHDAGTDALLALGAWREIEDRLRGARLSEASSVAVGVRRPGRGSGMSAGSGAATSPAKSTSLPTN